MKNASAKPLKLAGHQVRSIDTGGVDGRPLDEKLFAEPALPEHIDVGLLLETAGLAEGEEQQYATAYYLGGYRGRQLSEELGWSREHMLAVRRRVVRRLRAFDAASYRPADFVIRGASSRVLVFEEALENGARCFSLARLGGEFQAIMRQEQCFSCAKLRDFRKTAES